MPEIHATAVVENGAKLAIDVKVGPFSYIYAGTEIGAGSVIEGWCEIGRPFGDLPPLVLGANSRIRSHSVVYCGSVFGPNLTTGHHVTLREGTKAGRNLQIGTYGDIQGDCVIGDFVTCHSNVHIGKHSHVGSFCWFFPFVVLTNDPHPPSTVMMGVTVKDFAVVATQTTVLPGVTIGKGALVAAHSMVRQDVDADRIAAGSPAKDLGPTEKILLKDGSGRKAYPWTTHYREKYPAEVTKDWASV